MEFRNYKFSILSQRNYFNNTRNFTSNLIFCHYFYIITKTQEYVWKVQEIEMKVLHDGPIPLSHFHFTLEKVI